MSDHPSRRPRRSPKPNPTMSTQNNLPPKPAPKPQHPGWRIPGEPVPEHLLAAESEKQRVKDLAKRLHPETQDRPRPY